MEKFRGVDYYGIEGLLSEEERMIRDAVRDWVEAEFLPIVPEHHRAGTFPTTLIPQLGELGVFGATLKGYGCAGLNNVAYGLIMQELERGDSGLRSCASVQSGLVMYPIYAYGSDAQKDAWLPGLQSGARVGCFGLTEPDHGSDPGAMKTRAR
jgi:glutaryl-CoA dehydrogenase